MHPDNIDRQPATARRWTGAPPVLPEVSIPNFPPYSGQTYYDIAPIKPSDYKWRTAVAFFCTGLAAGAQVIATEADWFAGSDGRRIVRTGRYLAAAGGSLTTLTLISALHTPRRWYNMLRIFKPTSPMSIGIWSITPFTISSALTAAGQLLEDEGYARAGGWMGRFFSLPSATLAILVMTYMGTELEETNMPLWAGAHPALAPLYAAAGMSNAAAALLLLNRSNEEIGAATRALKQLAFISAAAEMALGSALDAARRRMPEARGIQKTRYDAGYRMVSGASTGSLVLWLLDGVDRSRRPAAGMLASLLKLAGGMLWQWVTVYAGRESGRHPGDYFEYTRLRTNTSETKHPAAPQPVKDVTPDQRGKASPAVRSGKGYARSAGLRWSLIAIGSVALLLSFAKKVEGAYDREKG